MLKPKSSGSGGFDSAATEPDSPTGRVRSLLSSRHAGQRITAALLILLGAAMLIASLGYGIWLRGLPGPGLFPAIIAGGLLVLSILWFAAGAGNPEPPVDHTLELGGNKNAITDETDEAFDLRNEPYNEQDQDDGHFDKKGVRLVLFTIAWALVPILLLDRIGVVLTMTLYVGGMLTVIGRMRWWLILPITAISSVVVAIGADRAGIVLPDPFSVLSIFGV